MACGGISSGFDAAEFLLLGAPLVQVCTEVMLKGFGAITRMKEELREFMGWHGYTTLADFIGGCRGSVTAFGGLNADYRVLPQIDHTLCSLCGACLVSCRDGGYQAITRSDGRMEIDARRCAGCSLCSHVCPETAISMMPW
jgi:Pyruvate/2-oxoacid:ferredoxin oxidoreductase delta subunit